MVSSISRLTGSVMPSMKGTSGERWSCQQLGTDWASNAKWAEGRLGQILGQPRTGAPQVGVPRKELRVLLSLVGDNGPRLLSLVEQRHSEGKAEGRAWEVLADVAG